jgi:subtilase family serine protease
VTSRESTGLRVGFAIVFVAAALVTIASAQPHVGPPPVALRSQSPPSAGPSPTPSRLPPIPPDIFVPTAGTCQSDPICATPDQLRRAYDLEPLYGRGLDGRGTTIAIIVEFGSPTIRRDLARFDADYGIPAPPTFDIIRPAGAIPPFEPNNERMSGYARETSLDVEWAHAMAPGAGILLVETPEVTTTGGAFDNIASAERNIVDTHRADVISQSFGFSERLSDKRGFLPLHRVYRDAAARGITVMASSGDEGPTSYDPESHVYLAPDISWPASDPFVTGVGGLRLHLDAQGNRTQRDEVWNETFDPAVVKDPPRPSASGGGPSLLYRRPAYQNGVKSVVGDARGVPDISLSASIVGGAVTFWSFPGSSPGYYVIGGTSEAAPELAGIVAVIDQAAGRPIGELNPLLYQLAARHAAGIVDVYMGTTSVRYRNGSVVRTAPGSRAVFGYDMATGLGTVDAAKLAPEIVAMLNHSG